jgi:hypothetical protein
VRKATMARQAMPSGMPGVERASAPDIVKMADLRAMAAQQQRADVGRRREA